MKYVVRMEKLRMIASSLKGCPSKFKEGDQNQYILLVFDDGVFKCVFQPHGIMTEVVDESDEYSGATRKSVALEVNSFRRVIEGFDRGVPFLELYEEKTAGKRFFVFDSSQYSKSGLVLKLVIPASSRILSGLPTYDSSFDLLEIRAELLQEAFSAIDIMDTKKSNHDKDYHRFGISFSMKGERLYLIGVDGTRLVEVDMVADVKNVGFLKKGFILETPAIDQLMPLLGMVRGDFMVRASVGKGGFRDFLDWSVVVEGLSFRVVDVLSPRGFPDCNGIVARNKPNKYILNRQALFDSVRRVMPLTNTVGVFFPGENDEHQFFKVGAVRDGKQFSQEEVDFEDSQRTAWTGFVMGMKTFFFTEVLQQISSDNVWVLGENAVSPIYIDPVYSEQEPDLRKRFVLMPLHLDKT